MPEPRLGVTDPCVVGSDRMEGPSSIPLEPTQSTRWGRRLGWTTRPRLFSRAVSQPNPALGYSQNRARDAFGTRFGAGPSRRAAPRFVASG
jgi:hypothetical protein